VATTDKETTWTVSEITLIATAGNAVEVDWAVANSKDGIAEGNCICCGGCT